MGDQRQNENEVEFYKFHGAGNDFIIIDNRDGRYTDFLSDSQSIIKLCQRHFGVDSDNVLEVKLHKEHGLEVVFTSRQGILCKMCGNGSRALVAFLKMSGIHTGTDDVTFLAGDGVHHGNYDPVARESWVSIQDISSSTVTQLSECEYVVNTGLPHLVVFTDYDVDDIEDANQHGLDLAKKWKQFEEEGSYLIVNFVFEKNGILHSRCCDPTFKKEIIACGTATAAIGVASSIRSGAPVDSDFSAQIQWPGGLMKCSLHRESSRFSQIQISGPVRQVFKGTFFVDALE